MYKFAVTFHALHGHPREQWHSLQGSQGIFELLSVYLEPGKSNLIVLLQQNFVLISSPSRAPRQCLLATPTKLIVEFLHPENQRVASAIFFSF